MTAWAFATAYLLDAAFFAALARAAELRSDEFKMQGLAVTAWAFATAHLLDAAFCGIGEGGGAAFM